MNQSGRPIGVPIGMLAALFTFLFIGIPLVKSGMNFWLAIAIQLGVMAAVILLVLKLMEKYGKRRKEQ